MMAKVFLTIFICICSFSYAKGLSEAFNVRGHFETMQVSETGEILVAGGGTVHKISERGNIVATRSLNGNMPVAMEMSRNEIYFFMEGHQEMRIMGPGLSHRENISLEESGIENPGPAAKAGHEEYWVFDRDQGKFLLLDHNFNVRKKSDNLEPHALQKLEPVAARYYNNKLFVNNDGQEIFVLSRHGGFERRLDARVSGNIQMADNRIFYIHNNRAKVMDINTGTAQRPDITLPVSNAREYLIKDSKLYILSSGGLRVYNI